MHSGTPLQVLQELGGWTSYEMVLRYAHLSTGHPLVAPTRLKQMLTAIWLRIRRPHALEDSWVIAEPLYAPCYIGGWTAAEYWGLTEQIFRAIVVMTTRKPRDRHPTFKGTDYLLKTISSTALFGTNAVCRGQVKVNVADPSRMTLDMLNDPSLGGGIRPTVDVFRAYIGSDKKDIMLLMQYADRLGNGAVFKRLGFTTERVSPNEQELITACRARLTKGNAKLDLALPADKLVSAWRLWIPSNWAKEKPSDRATGDC